MDDPEYQSNLEYYKGLISFRKEHGLLRLTSADEIAKRITAVEGLDKNVIAFNMDNSDKGVADENAENIFLIFNPNQSETTVALPDGDWNVCAAGINAGTKSLDVVSGEITVEPISAVILTKGDSTIVSADDKKAIENSSSDEESANENVDSSSKNKVHTGVIAGIIVAIAAVAGIATYIFRKKKQ